MATETEHILNRIATALESIARSLGNQNAAYTYRSTPAFEERGRPAPVKPEDLDV